MNSIKIKSKSFKTADGRSIAQIVILPEENKFRIYVAWENEPAAKKGFMGFFKSDNLYIRITPEAIRETMGYGRDIAHLPECKKIFKPIL